MTPERKTWQSSWSTPASPRSLMSWIQDLISAVDLSARQRVQLEMCGGGLSAPVLLPSN
jgi:hypothetical protein